MAKPPFRAEHVGSFPRPEKLMQAREDFKAGKIAKADLKEIEKEATREIVALQERTGIGAITDGEFPKSGWREFLYEKTDGWDGELVESPFTFTNYDGTTWKAQGVPKVTGPIRRRDSLSADDFDVLKTMTRRPIKANIPTPSIAHMVGDQIFQGSPYSTREAYMADVIKVMQQEIADLAKRGCTYLQMDEVPLATLCDPKNQAVISARGEDPTTLIEFYIDSINVAVKAKPKDMTVAVHMCRGNVGHGMADGGYEPIAERMFGGLNVNGFFLEYDTPRAGDFKPLRFVPKGKIAVLGLVSTKLPEIESADSLKRRLDEAAKILPMEQLALSPQCGFSSVANRGRLTPDVVERKLSRIVEVADSVWGRA
jgi:5-methyltetrahydropteroyltriglutamate--homocysteine methyltransferase